MADPFPIRAIDGSEFAAFFEVIEHAFNSRWPTDEVIEYERATFEFDRSLVACDGDRFVGTACAFSFEMTVPGATIPVGAVSAVSVLPSHRRRGVLSALIRHQLADIRDRGEAVAALFASETGIYGRFGYGPASLTSRFTVRRGDGGLHADVPHDPGLRLRVAEPQDARAELAAVYDAVRPSRPGLWARDDRWWSSALHDPENARDGACPLRCVIAEDGGGRTAPRGYALFSVTPSWGIDGLPAGVISVRELVTVDPAATAAIWADLLSRDLVGELTARLRPVDDPLLHLLAEPRRARAQVSDGLWVRLIDVRRALTQRRYACPADVVVEVTDELCPRNQGRWRLHAGSGDAGSGDLDSGDLDSGDLDSGDLGSVDAGSGGAGSGNVGMAGSDNVARPAQLPGVAGSCERTTAAPDVLLPVAALGAAYLGGTRLGSLAAAGLVTEIRPGAVAALSTALSWDPAPWCPMIF